MRRPQPQATTHRGLGRPRVVFVSGCHRRTGCSSWEWAARAPRGQSLHATSPRPPLIQRRSCRNRATIAETPRMNTKMAPPPDPPKGDTPGSGAYSLTSIWLGNQNSPIRPGVQRMKRLQRGAMARTKPPPVTVPARRVVPGRATKSGTPIGARWHRPGGTCRLRPPERRQLRQLVRPLLGQVVALARVGLGVEQLPPLGRELGPGIRHGRGHRRGLPAIVVDAAGAEHRVELGLLARRLLVVQTRHEALALERDLGGTR